MHAQAKGNLHASCSSVSSTLGLRTDGGSALPLQGAKVQSWRGLLCFLHSSWIKVARVKLL